MYLTGWGILLLLKIKIQDLFAHLFAQLLIGCTLFVVVTSVCYTKGITVNLFFVPIGLLLAYKFGFKGKLHAPYFTERKVMWNYAYLLIGLLIIYSWRFGSVYSSNGIPLVPHGDVVFYANCIDFIMQTGQENSSVNYINPIGSSPYHYFELWFGAGVSSLFNGNATLSLVLVVFTIGNFIIWIGLVAVMSHFKKKLSITDLILCLSLLFITGITLSFYEMIPFMKYIHVYARNTLNYSKLFTVYMYLIAALLLLLNNHKFYGTLCLLCIPITSISTAIGILSGIFVHPFFAFKKKLSDFSGAIASGIMCALILIFYKVLTTPMATHVSTNFSEISAQIMNAHFVKTALNIFIGASIQFAVLFSPFLFLFILNNKAEWAKWLKSDSILIIGLTYVLSLFGWSLLHNKTSSVQIFTNTSVSMFTLSASYILIHVWVNASNRKILNTIIIGLFVFVGFKNSISEYRYEYPQSSNYIKTVLEISDNLSSTGSFIYDTKDYSSINFSYIANFVIQGNFLIYSQKQTFPLSISPHNFVVSSDPLLANMQKVALNNTPFWIYVEKQKKDGMFHSIPESQVRFIEELGINYLIYTKNVVLPGILEDKIKEKIIDENTGEIFALLHQP